MVILYIHTINFKIKIMSLDYNSIKRKIESVSCRQHHERAVFTKTAKGFTVKACCAEFEKIISKKAEEIVALIC